MDMSPTLSLSTGSDGPVVPACVRLFDDPVVDLTGVESKCGVGYVVVSNRGLRDDKKKIEGGCPLGVRGSWRVVATCDRPLWGDSTVYGEWVGNGAMSRADCGRWYVATGRLERRS